ncbi:LytTR family DNA-binding domain-containing protein [Fluviicola taffensis]|uniref:LytR/AlgR family response regulator transcription factor n=1 Tax=Fluviicola taffensis TaxID=191579 RepID=UPI003137A02D
MFIKNPLYMNMHCSKQEKALFVKRNTSLIKLDKDSISHIMVEGRYSELYVNEKKFVCRKSLAELLELFPEDLFFRAHRNFLVNKLFVRHIDTSEYTVYLTTGDLVPISRRYMENAKGIYTIVT